MRRLFSQASFELKFALLKDEDANPRIIRYVLVALEFRHSNLETVLLSVMQKFVSCGNIVRRGVLLLQPSVTGQILILGGLACRGTLWFTQDRGSQLYFCVRSIQDLRRYTTDF